MLVITHSGFQVGLGDVDQKSDIVFFESKFYTIEPPDTLLGTSYLNLLFALRTEKINMKRKSKDEF